MSAARKNREFVLWVVFFDLLAITASYLFTYLFRFVSGIVPLKGDMPSFVAYTNTLLVILPVYLWLFRGHGLYDPQRRIRRIEEIFQVLKAVTYSIVILTAMSFFYRDLSYSRIYLVFFWIFSALFVSVMRYILIEWEYRRKLQQKQIDRVLLIGANRQARQIIQWARNNRHYGQEVLGVLAKEPQLAGKHFEGVPVLGVIEQSLDYIQQIKPDRVLLTDPTYQREKITELVAVCEDRWIEFKVVADVYGLLTRHVDVEYVSSVPLLGFKALPLDDVWNRMIKRCFDLTVSAAMLIATSPLWIFIVLAIKWCDRGPIFYVQERIGRDERCFNVLKFRTMKVDAEAKTGPVWTQPNDARRTWIGNFLRRWNLDELPQLINVLRGEMSLVGPRPERPHFVDQFRENLPRYMGRHRIKSGLTGWAQVNGFRGNTSIQERLKYDLYYMENWSLLFDVEILFMTLSARSLKNAY